MFAQHLAEWDPDLAWGHWMLPLITTVPSQSLIGWTNLKDRGQLSLQGPFSLWQWYTNCGAWPPRGWGKWSPDLPPSSLWPCLQLCSGPTRSTAPSCGPSPSFRPHSWPLFLASAPSPGLGSWPQFLAPAPRPCLQALAPNRGPRLLALLPAADPDSSSGAGDMQTSSIMGKEVTTGKVWAPPLCGISAEAGSSGEVL